MQQTGVCRGFFSFFSPNAPFHFTPLHSILSNFLFAHLHCILFFCLFSRSHLNGGVHSGDVTK